MAQERGKRAATSGISKSIFADIFQIFKRIIGK